MKITGKNMSEYSSYDDYDLSLGSGGVGVHEAFTGHYNLQFDNGNTLQVSKEQFDEVSVDDEVIVEIKITKV